MHIFPMIFLNFFSFCFIYLFAKWDRTVVLAVYRFFFQAPGTVHCHNKLLRRNGLLVFCFSLCPDGEEVADFFYLQYEGVIINLVQYIVTSRWWRKFSLVSVSRIAGFFWLLIYFYLLRINIFTLNHICLFMLHARKLRPRNTSFPETFEILWHIVLVAQSCPTLCNPLDCTPPVSSVHGILQVRMLEWVDIPFSRSFQPRDWIWVSCIAG